MKLKNSGHSLAAFDQFKSEIHSELKRVKYKDLEDMVFRFQLTYNEIMDIFDVKYTAGPTIGYTVPPGVYEINDNNLMLKSLLPGKVKVNNTIDDIRLKSNLATNKTIKFTEKLFFLHNIRFYSITLRSFR